MRSTARQKSQPRTASSSDAARPRVLITGGRSARRRAVERSLAGVRANVASAPWSEVAEKLEPGFAALVLAEPLPATPADAVAAVREQPAGRRPALFLLVSADSSARKVRGIYRAGATAVIEWPREKALFADILAETMGMSIVRGRSTRPDVALCRTVRAHLRLGPAPGGGIRLSCSKGAVTATGEARSLAELRAIVETIATVPGVRRVLTSDLRVAPSGIPDSTIKKRIRSVVRATSEIEEGALAVAVRGGRVRLRGEVPSRAQFHDLLDLIATVKGVRDLDWEVTIPGRKPQSDAVVARRLRRAMRTLHPKETIDVDVLAGVAVLSGKARSLAAKRAAERHVERDDDVRRVVNKVTVGGR